MEEKTRGLVPISEEEMDMAYGVRCKTCVNCENANEIGMGARCCKYDCFLGLFGAFISKNK